MRRLFSLLFFCCGAIETTTFAYGPLGHQIVGAVADRRLADMPTGKRVSLLLDGFTLEKAAAIPDEINGWDKKGADDPGIFHYSSRPRVDAELRAFWKANPPTQDHNSPVPSHHSFHYPDVPVSSLEKYGDGQTGRSQWDVVHMIGYCIAVLKGEVPEENPRKITKAVAIILLAHYVGDIHQPLHVGAEFFGQSGQKVDPDRSKPAFEDQGGNTISLELPAARSGKRTKLHGFWDNDAVNAQFPNVSGTLPKEERRAKIDVAKKELIQKFAAQEPKDWRLPANISLKDYAETWANQILPLAREAHERLTFTGVHPEQWQESTVAVGSAHEKPMPDRVSYRDWSARVVRNELHVVGWRLADLLEKALSTEGGQTIAASSPSAAGANGAQPAPVPAAASPAATATPTSSATPTPRRTPAADPVYGEYPVKYKHIIMDWLYMHLYDPPSAKIEWQTEPRRADLPGPGGRKLYGYLVLFTVNARNQFGAYTGKQTHGALIRNGEVIKTTGFGYGSPAVRPN